MKINYFSYPGVARRAPLLLEQVIDTVLKVTEIRKEDLYRDYRIKGAVNARRLIVFLAFDYVDNLKQNELAEVLNKDQSYISKVKKTNSYLMYEYKELNKLLLKTRTELNKIIISEI